MVHGACELCLLYVFSSAAARPASRMACMCARVFTQEMYTVETSFAFVCNSVLDPSRFVAVVRPPDNYLLYSNVGLELMLCSCCLQACLRSR